MNLTCDNKKAQIDVKYMWIRLHGCGTVTINGHQGMGTALDPHTTVTMKGHSGDVMINHKAKAIIENATIKHLFLLSDGSALIVNGKINDLFVDGVAKGSTAWLVNSAVKTLDNLPMSDVYHINTGDNDLSEVSGMVEETLKGKADSTIYTVKGGMNSFNALWNQRPMPNENIQEEHKE